jgi:hypothetical protein
MGARIDCDGVRVRREHRLAELFEPMRVLGEDGDVAALGGDVEAMERAVERKDVRCVADAVVADDAQVAKIEGE